jgi:hypothetical protein
MVNLSELDAPSCLKERLKKPHPKTGPGCVFSPTHGSLEPGII